MTSHNHKIRLVRCPKCRKVLAELPELTVYQCGGCGTVLQAKNHKKDIKGTGLCSNDAKPVVVQKDEHQQVAKDEAKSPNLEANVPPSGEFALHRSTERHQNELDHCKREDSSFSDGHCDSAELTVHENRLSSPESQAHEGAVENKFPLDPHAVKDHTVACDFSEDHSGEICCDGLPSSTELTDHEYEQSSPESKGHMEVDEGERHSGQDSKSGQIELVDFSGQNPDLLSDSTELTFGSEQSSPKSQAHIHKVLYNQCYERDQNELGDCINAPSADISIEASSQSELNIYKRKILFTRSGADTIENKILTSVEQPNEGDPHSVKDHNEVNDYSKDHPGIINNDALSSLTELTGHVHEQSSPESQRHMEVDEKCLSGQDSGRNKIEFGDFCSDLTKLTCGSERSSSGSQARIHNILFNQCYKRDQNKIGDCIMVPSADTSSEASSLSELNVHKHEALLIMAGADTTENTKTFLEQHNEGDHSDIGNVSRKWLGNTEVMSSTELACQEIVKAPLTGEADTKLDVSGKNCRTYNHSGEENLPLTRARDPIITAKTLASEDIESDDHASPPNEYLEHHGKSSVEGFNCVSSIDTLENIPLVDPSSELSVALRDLYKSSARSFDTYDASVSSYEGMDDPIPDPHPHPSVRNFKDGSFFSSKGLPSREEIVANNLLTGESGSRHQEMSSLLFSPGKKHQNMRVSKLYQDELSNPRKCSHTIRHMMRLDSDECPSRPPLFSRGAQVTESSSSYDKLHNRLKFHSATNPQYTELDKMELLRMVYELQDELSRIYVPKENDGRIPAQVAREEKQMPTYCSCLAPEGETNPDMRFSGYLGRCSQEGRLPRLCKGSRIAFSGEATCSRDQVCSCLHCRSQDWHWSAQLPQHTLCCSKWKCTSYPCHNCCHLFHSSPSSRQHYNGSEHSSKSHDAMSDASRHNLNDRTKFCPKEKHQLMRRHFRPIAGGAPIIACYHCSKLLQLPADFLLFRRRCHYLRCNFCSEVLTFSLKSKTHLVPCLPGSMAPPPSEVGEFSDAVSRSNKAATSLCKSYSTDADPFHPAGRNSNHRRTSSVDSSESVDEKQESSFRKSLNPWRSFNKSSSEIEELKPRSASPLHRLMGYTSASEVLWGED